MTKIPDKPKRPLGVSLAIVVGVMAFTVLPIVNVLFFWQLNNLMVIEPGSISGADLMGGLSTLEAVIQVGLALSFLVVAVLTWLGRPPWIRHIFTGTVIFIAGLTIVLQILPGIQNSSTALDSSREFGGIWLSYLVFVILIGLYAVWYMNRWAARAFFRGYYQPEDLEIMRSWYADSNPSADEVLRTT